MNVLTNALGATICLALAWPTFAADDRAPTGEYDVQSEAEIAAAARAIAAEGFREVDARRGLLPGDREQVLARYAHLDPRREIATDLLEAAVTYFDLNRTRFANQDYLLIVDFTPRSDRYRAFVVNIRTGEVERYHTTHGLNSDRRPRDGVAEAFGNGVDSGMSSLGPARTAEVYSGKFKRAVRLDGLARSNSNLRRRAVVLHGWDKVHEANVIQGLSWGCLTFDWRVRDDVIDKVKGGALVYVGRGAVSKKRR